MVIFALNVKKNRLQILGSDFKPAFTSNTLKDFLSSILELYKIT